MRRSRLPSERGQALVEFALLLPALMLLVAGMLHFGKMLNYWLDANHLANEGVRFAVVNKNPAPSPTATCADGDPATMCLQEWIESQGDSAELVSGGTESVPSGLNASICYPDAVAPDYNADAAKEVGDPVRVRVEVVYHLIPILGFGQITITGTATQRIERSPTFPLSPAYDPDGVCP